MTENGLNKTIYGDLGDGLLSLYPPCILINQANLRFWNKSQFLDLMKPRQTGGNPKITRMKLGHEVACRVFRNHGTQFWHMKPSC